MKNWYEEKSGQGKPANPVQPAAPPPAPPEPPEPGAYAPGEVQKLPRATVAVLAFLCAASLVTGLVYWYTAYFRPREYTVPAMAAVVPHTPEENTDTAVTIAETPTLPPAAPEPPPRPQLDPLPEFVEKWAQFNNTDIVGRLVFAGVDKMVLQAEIITEDTRGLLDSRGEATAGGLTRADFAVLDCRVDLLLGDDHNMVVFLEPGTPAFDALRAYRDDGFFLRYPTIAFYTLYGLFEWEIFSFYAAPSVFPFTQINHASDEAWGEALEAFTLASMYNTRLDVMQYDQVLTITAPIEAGADLHYVLQARMLRKITS